LTKFGRDINDRNSDVYRSTSKNDEDSIDCTPEGSEPHASRGAF